MGMDPSVVMALVLQFKYPILVPASLLAGLLVDMIAGVAIRLGYLEFWLAYVCLMLGELIGDVAWYWIGYYWGERFARGPGKYIGITESAIASAERLFRKYNQQILFSSKLTTGFGFSIPILFTAGMTRISFYRYMFANISGQFFWTGVLIAVGYFFGDFYLRVNSVFEKLAIISAFIILVLCFIGFIRYLRSRIL